MGKPLLYTIIFIVNICNSLPLISKLHITACATCGHDRVYVRMTKSTSCSRAAFYSESKLTW